ncbi:MAG: terpene cyclase/mutase family protein [Fimbriiglobus sp.]|jgi:squalene-hopene/tetraprenyl-beta-curcumene cyclase|nr:terpene cyclase/mutase family protein [Fimbriiglobus sp.]
MFRPRFALPALAAVLLALPAAKAADTAPDSKELQQVLDQAYEYLKGKQGQDGSWMTRVGPGVTALTAAALVKSGKPADDPVVAKAIEYVTKFVQKDGGVYSRGLETYTTALAIVAFQECNKEKKYDAIIAAAVKYLKGVQESNGTDDKSLEFGGAGYGTKSRPDTSNTGFFVEALIASGAGKDDPAVKKALTFLSKAQNLPGEYNDQPFAKKAGDDDLGGFVYEPGAQGDEKSPKRTAAGGLRSEGGMTYVGLKSFLYAGVDKNDKRVKAAVEWVRKHYTLDENPGMKQSGLFYYYHTFAKAMDALGEDEFADAKGTKHPWRKELFEKLKGTQAKDGSWVNKDPSFMENSPELCTAFAVLSLSYTKAKK